MIQGLYSQSSLPICLINLRTNKNAYMYGVEIGLFIATLW